MDLAALAPIYLHHNLSGQYLALQLLNEAELDLKNSAELGGCYPLRPPTEICRILDIPGKPNLFIQNIFKLLKVAENSFQYFPSLRV